MRIHTNVCVCARLSVYIYYLNHVFWNENSKMNTHDIIAVTFVWIIFFCATNLFAQRPQCIADKICYEIHNFVSTRIFEKKSLVWTLIYIFRTKFMCHTLIWLLLHPSISLSLALSHTLALYNYFSYSLAITSCVRVAICDVDNIFFFINKIFFY